MPSRKLLLVVTSLSLLAVIGDFLLRPRTSVLAQGTAASFTINSTGNGVAIVDQATGAITVCSSLVNVSGVKAVPTDKCAMLGRITPGSSSGSISVATPQNSLFVLNNQNGHIMQCATVDFTTGGIGSPVGDLCVDQGSAFR